VEEGAHGRGLRLVTRLRDDREAVLCVLALDGRGRLRSEGMPPQSLGLGRRPPARLKETAACGEGSARSRALACHTAPGWQGGHLVCALAGREGQTAE